MADLRKQTGSRGPTQGQFTKPSVQYPTPDTGEYLIVERKTVDSKEQPIAYGTAHPTLTDAKLINQSFLLEEDGRKTRTRIYSKRGAVAAQNAYNFAQQFAADSNSHRVLIRSYTLPAPVTPLAKGTADTEIATCILTREEHSPRGGEDNHHIQVTRIYEELPGPWIPFTRYDDDLGPIQGRRRAVVNADQEAARTATTSTTYEARDGSTYVLWEIEENWSDGTGSAGNPAYPIRVRDFYDDARGPVQESRQIVVATGSEVGSIAHDAGTITQIDFDPHPNKNLLYRTTTTYAVSGPEREEYAYDNDRGRVKRTRSVVATSADATLAIVGSTVTETSYTPINEILWEKIVEVWHTEEHELVTTRWDDNLRALVTITSEIVPESDAFSSYPTHYLDIDETPLSRVAKRRTVVSIASLPADRTEYKTDMFTFPAILEDIDIDKYSVGNRGGFGNPSGADFWNGKNTVVVVNPTVRPALSIPTEHKIVTSWHSGTAPTPTAVYTIAPNSCQFFGKLVNFNLGQVLMDELTFDIDADAKDPNYAGLTETATIGASVPTATDYEAAVALAADQIIASDVVHYRGNIWFKRNISIKLK